MNEEAIHERARRAGLVIDWVDAAEQPHRVPTRSLTRILDALGDGESGETGMVTGVVGQQTRVPGLVDKSPVVVDLEDGTRHSFLVGVEEGVPPLPAGYHTVHHGKRSLRLAVAPSRCLTIDDVAPDQRLWGLVAQVYSLRRPGDGGIGDTTAVANLATAAAGQGADALVLSPMHCLFPADLSRFSPYAPSSRLFLNPLLTDPATVLGRARVRATINSNESSGSLIDWPKAASGKLAQLRQLFDDFALKDLATNSGLADKFRAFMLAGGQSLEIHARLEAERASWSAPALFYAFLQWLADGALAAAQAAARTAGMRIGLISDLAIGLDRTSTEVRAKPRDYLDGLSIGAPPDAFNAEGQDWGLTTFSPHGLKADNFTPFIATLRAAMRHAGGVRIDHVMGLMRLWVLPQGASPSEGAYLTYPLDDLMRLVALESHRNRSIVIGEDLGTVPRRFRKKLRACGIAGMDVLWFQRSGQRFLPAAEWRDDAAAMTTTHDLPTVAGWWSGADLEIRRELGRVTDREIAARPMQRAELWRTFTETGAASGPAPDADDTGRAVDAAIDFVARSPAPLALVPLEDIMGATEQPNLPGTTEEHPNWRRRFDITPEELLRSPAAQRRMAILDERKR